MTLINFLTLSKIINDILACSCNALLAVLVFLENTPPLPRTQIVEAFSKTQQMFLKRLTEYKRVKIFEIVFVCNCYEGTYLCTLLGCRVLESRGYNI